MEYRKLPHGEEQISVIGLGNSSLTSQVGEKEIQATVEMALESGVNYFDMAAGDAAPFAAYGKALAGCREKAYLQVHFGADYHTGKYGWTQDLEEIKRSISWQLKPFRQITSTLALSTVWMSWPTWKKPSAAVRWTTSNL